MAAPTHLPKTKRLTAYCLTAVLAWTTPARSQVPTVDVGLGAQIARTVTTMSQELQQITAIARSMSSLLNVQRDISGALGAIGAGVGDLGGGTVGQLISSARLGFLTVQRAKNTAEMIMHEVRNLSLDPLHSLSLLNIFQSLSINGYPIYSTNAAIQYQIQTLNRIMSGQMPVPAAMQSLSNILYVPIGNPTADQIEAVNATRRAVVQNAALSAMTASAAASQSIANDGQTALANLSNGVANASDLRGDIKANSAIVLKIAEQVAGQNALLGRLLYLESATTTAMQGVYGPNSRNTMGLPGTNTSSSSWSQDPNTSNSSTSNSSTTFDPPAPNTTPDSNVPCASC